MNSVQQYSSSIHEGVPAETRIKEYDPNRPWYLLGRLSLDQAVIQILVHMI